MGISAHPFAFVVSFWFIPAYILLKKILVLHHTTNFAIFKL